LNKRVNNITAAVLKHSNDLKKCTEALQEVPGVGEFFAWQVTCDLLESRILSADENNWVLMGPGSKMGLILLFPSLLDELKNHEAFVAKAKALQQSQVKNFEAKGIDFPYWGNKLISLKNMEHILCEFSRYCGFLSKTTRSSGKFIPRPSKETTYN